jgi:hypothetical protein
MIQGNTTENIGQTVTTLKQRERSYCWQRKNSGDRKVELYGLKVVIRTQSSFTILLAIDETKNLSGRLMMAQGFTYGATSYQE